MTIRPRSPVRASFALLVVVTLLAPCARAQSPTPFVPPDFKVPARLETAEFRPRTLGISDVVKEWIAKEWPFKSVAYPGRGLDRAAFRSLPDEKR